MNMQDRTNIKDRVIACFLAIIIFACGFFNLDNNCDWGDDFAAYMADGIAIAKGSYREQIHINSFLRDGNSQTGAEHVHAFGMPLTHSIVYLLCGFDRVNFDNLYWYKLPSLLFLALLAGFFYIFMRKRSGRAASVAAVFILCCSGTFFYSVRNLGNDIIYMSVSFLCFLECENLVENGRNKYIHGALLGLCLWFAYSVRLNGIAVLITSIIFLMIEYLKKKRRFVISDLIPYALFGVLYFAVNCLIFPKPTSTSSFSQITLPAFMEGIKYYAARMYEFFGSITETVFVEPVRFVLKLLVPRKDPVTAYRYLNNICTVLFFALTAVGVIWKGLRENLHITLYMIISFFITAAFNLGQELRYLYTILPFVVMYFCYGIGFIGILIGKKRKTAKKRSNAPGYVISAAVCVLLLFPVVRADIENVTNPSREPLTAYSDTAVEVYDYIRNNTDEASVIAFFKPRALFLNTERLSFIPGRNDVGLSLADYYLYYKFDPNFLISDENADIYRLIFENSDFALYRET